MKGQRLIIKPVINGSPPSIYHLKPQFFAQLSSQAPVKSKKKVGVRTISDAVGVPRAPSRFSSLNVGEHLKMWASAQRVAISSAWVTIFFCVLFPHPATPEAYQEVWG